MQIKIVETKKDLKEFILLPWQVYKNDPHWIPPLISEVEFILNPQKNPFWEHAQQKLFLAKSDGKTVGRIAGIIDQNHINFHGENVGFFGFFEAFNNYQIAELLLSEVREWLKGKGMKAMRGPMNPSMNDECGFLLEGFDSSPVIMMTYNPRYYLDFIEGFGLRKAKDLFAFIKYTTQEFPEYLSKLAERAKEKGIIVRPLDMKNLKSEVRLIKDIYNSAWEKNWGFVPMTDKEIDVLAEKLKPIAVPEIVCIAEFQQEPIGVIIVLPDFNQVLRKLNGKLGLIEILKFLYYRRKIDGCRALVGGVKKRFRKMGGVFAALYSEVEKNGRKLGYKWGELSWTLEDNFLINQQAIALGHKIYKKYRIYEMKI